MENNRAIELLRKLGEHNDTIGELFGPRERHFSNCWCKFPLENERDDLHEPLCQEIRAFLVAQKAGAS